MSAGSGLTAPIDGLQRLAAAGDPLFKKLIDEGTVDQLHVALHELPDALKPHRDRQQ